MPDDFDPDAAPNRAQWRRAQEGFVADRGAINDAGKTIMDQRADTGLLLSDDDLKALGEARSKDRP